MARRKSKRYRYEYRGRRRRKGSAVLKVIIALLVLILLAFLALVFVLDGRIEYTDDGVRVVLPWMEQQTEQPGLPEEPDGSEPPVFIVDDPEEPTEEPSEEPSPEPVKPVPEITGAIEVSVESLLDGTAAGLVAQAGGNTLVVEMKESSGKVYWDSRAALPGALADADGRVTAAVRELAEQEGLYLVARVVCFRDQVMAAAEGGSPLMTRGGNVWYDTRGLRWVSPASQQVRNYMIDLCLELADLGFDEILLDCAGYPWFGETHVLATNERRPENFAEVVADFWRELDEKLSGRNVLLSAVANNSMTHGIDEYSGITPILLRDYADRVWAQSLPQDSILADRLVLVDGTAADGNWADLDPILN